MSISLKAIRTSPKDKWFHFKVVAGSLLPAEPDAQPDLSLQIKYMTQREYRKLMTDVTADRVERKAVSKHGLKALITDDAIIHRAICQTLILDWRMNVRAAYALHTECDFSQYDADAPIEMNQDNLDVMIENSNLAELVNSIIAKHENWFEFNDGEEAEGNSEPGGSGSTAAQAAETASQPT